MYTSVDRYNFITTVLLYIYRLQIVAIVAIVVVAEIDICRLNKLHLYEGGRKKLLLCWLNGIVGSQINEPEGLTHYI